MSATPPLVGEDDNLVLLHSFHDIVPGRGDLIKDFIRVWFGFCYLDLVNFTNILPCSFGSLCRGARSAA